MFRILRLERINVTFIIFPFFSSSINPDFDRAQKLFVTDSMVTVKLKSLETPSCVSKNIVYMISFKSFFVSLPFSF